MIYFVLIFSLLFFVLSWRRLDWAVMFLIAALPAYLIRFSILGIPSTLLEAMILIAFATWLIKNYKQVIENLKLKFKNRNSTIEIRQLKRYPFDIEIILLLIVSFVAAGISGFSSEALGIWKAYFFEPALFFILVLNVFKKERGIDKIILSLAVSALIMSLFAVYQRLTGAFIFNEFWAAEETRRVTSFFSYPNAVGLYFGPVILILTGWARETLSQIKKQQTNKQTGITNYELRITNFLIIKASLIILIILLSALAIYFAKSEGALIGIIAGLIAFGLLAGKKARWITMAIIILSVLGVMIFAPVKDYVNNKILLRDLSGQIRKAQWAETWGMLKGGRLFLGSGLSNYQNAIKSYHQEGIFVRDYNDPDWHRKTVFNAEYRKKVWQPLEIYLYPHNIVLNFWVELGLAGALLFVWIIIKYLYWGIFNIQHSTFNKFINIGLIGAMVVIIVHGLVDVPYFKNDLAVMFWLMIAILGIIDIQHNQNN